MFIKKASILFFMYSMHFQTFFRALKVAVVFLTKRGPVVIVLLDNAPCSLRSVRGSTGNKDMLQDKRAESWVERALRLFKDFIKERSTAHDPGVMF